MALVICMMDAHSGWGTSTATDALICCSTTQEIATGGLAHTPASADSCSGALRETPLGSARYGTDARSGQVTSPALIAPKRCSTTQEIATGGLAHTPASADSCSGALRETPLGSARYGTGGHSGLATLTVTDAPMCCFITQEIATGGLAHTPASADSCSGALREILPGSVTWQTDGPSGPATSREPTGVRFCSITQETATGGWGRTTGVSCSGALRETPLGSVRWRTGGPSGWGTSTATDAPISCSTTPATATAGWAPIAAPVAQCSGALQTTH